MSLNVLLVNTLVVFGVPLVCQFATNEHKKTSKKARRQILQLVKFFLHNINFCIIIMHACMHVHTKMLTYTYMHNYVRIRKCMYVCACVSRRLSSQAGTHAFVLYTNMYMMHAKYVRMYT